LIEFTLLEEEVKQNELMRVVNQVHRLGDQKPELIKSLYQ
jgi:hypothetical protein